MQTALCSHVIAEAPNIETVLGRLSCKPPTLTRHFDYRLQVGFRWAGEANIALAIEPIVSLGTVLRMVPKVSNLRVRISGFRLRAETPRAMPPVPRLLRWRPTACWAVTTRAVDAPAPGLLYALPSLLPAANPTAAVDSEPSGPAAATICQMQY